MKLLTILTILPLLFFSISCSKANNTERFSADGNVIEIRERLFIGQVNEIYLNAQNYIGKTIKLEGIFKQEQHDNKQYNFVVRYGPGCCGDDGLVGFEISWGETWIKEYPKINSWVEAIGELRFNNENPEQIYLDLSSLAVLDKRGAIFVPQ